MGKRTRNLVLLFLVLIIFSPLFIWGYVEYYLYKIGEVDQVDRILDAIENEEEQYTFNEWNSSSPYVKFHLLKKLKPEVVVFGSPRFNQFRREMFQPYSFYNAGMLAPKLNAAEGLLLSLPKEALPKVLFVLVDPYMFRDAPNNHPVDYNAIVYPVTTKKVYKKLFAFWKDNPGSIWWIFDKDAGSKYLGLRAYRSKRGVRSIDGSVSYLDLHNRDYKTQVRDEINRGKTALRAIKAKGILKGYESPMLESAFNDWDKVCKAGDKVGTTVIGIGLPFSQAYIDIMEADTVKYKLWKEFQDPKNVARLNESGYFFNCTKFEYVGGNKYMMMDNVHCTEAISALSLAKALDHPGVKEVLPELNPEFLRSRVKAHSDNPAGIMFPN